MNISGTSCRIPRPFPSTCRDQTFSTFVFFIDTLRNLYQEFKTLMNRYLRSFIIFVVVSSMFASICIFQSNFCYPYRVGRVEAGENSQILHDIHRYSQRHLYREVKTLSRFVGEVSSTFATVCIF